MRRIILDHSKRAHVGHIGSSLCVVEILAVLYGGVMHLPSPEDPQRDRFVLSKGHAALALYAALHLRGWLGEAQLGTFCGSDTLLGVHPEHALRGIDFSSGSLGMGLGFAAGAALAARMREGSGRAFALLSDAECNEGSVWEAAMFAAHHRLSNLTAVIDLNGQQALGHTSDVLALDDMARRWECFGWDVHTVNGHDLTALRDTFDHLDYREGRPHLILAETTFGKGVSFMENTIKWHYWPMNDEEYALALAEVEGGAP
jgi:transketolase